MSTASVLPVSPEQLTEQATLFSPLTIRGLTIPNRIGVSPMCQYCAVDGFANDWHLVHLGSRAVGGAGLVFVEATAVTPQGRISPGDLGLWSDDHIEPLRRITDFVKSQGSAVGIQLAHAGRKASTACPWEGGQPLSPETGEWDTIAPSAVPFAGNYPTPAELTREQITELVNAFASATQRAKTAGFDVIEIHAAHGYLIHEFLSPLSNHRTDEYGGAFQNRTRFLRDIVQAVRANWAEEFPLFVRISSTDWVEGGWAPEDSVELARALSELGVDVVDCSSGGNVPTATIPVRPGYQVEFADRIRREAGVRTAAVGMITDAAQAEGILRAGSADIVLLGREFLRNPYWPVTAAHALQADVVAPVQYGRAFVGARTRG